MAPWPLDVVARAIVPIDGYDTISAHRREIVARYDELGFVIVRPTGAPIVDASTVVTVESAFGLGDRHVAPFYLDRPEFAETGGIVTLAIVDDPVHSAFDTGSAQALHVDGTLMPVGSIRTSVLVCGSPAASGGDSILFNSVAAYEELCAVDRDAAAALTEDCIVRTGNLPGYVGESRDPAFVHRADGTISTCFSVASTVSWDTELGGARLGRALAFMERMREASSPHLCSVQLQAGDALILANDRLAHGRTAFTDAPGRRRVIYRSLYKDAPRAAVEARGGPR